MDYFNLALTRLFDLLLWPFGAWPTGGLIFISALAGVLMLVLFKLASNQKKIRRSRDLINAHLLAMRLYQDEPAVMLASQRAVLKANLSYLRYAVVPLVFILPPIVLVMAQLELRWGAAPLRPGDEAVVKAVFDSYAPREPRLEVPGNTDVRVQAPPLVVTTPALRIPYLNEVDWRIKAQVPGRYVVRVVAGPRSYPKEVVVGDGRRLAKVNAVSPANIWRRLFHPGERAPGDGVKEITVIYPRREDKFFGVTVSWLVTFFVVSLVAAFAFKGILRTEI